MFSTTFRNRGRRHQVGPCRGENIRKPFMQVFARVSQMKRKCILSLFAGLFITLLCCQASWGAKAYVADPKDIALRAGPGPQYRVVTQVPSGSELEVVKSNDWIRVKFETPSGEVKEGWVQSQAVSAYPPESVFIRDLQNENARIREQAVKTDQEKLDLAHREKALAEKLKNLEAEYAALRNVSSNYLKFKEEYDSLKNSLTQAEENIQALIDENESLKLTERIKWFAVGALVLFFGWLIGWFSSRSQRKRRPTYTL